MNKRLIKRHKRQVLRAKQQVRFSEPDVRTPEEIKEAREASRPVSVHRYDAKPLSALRDKLPPSPDDGNNIGD